MMIIPVVLRLLSADCFFVEFLCKWFSCGLVLSNLAKALFSVPRKVHSSYIFVSLAYLCELEDT